MNNVLEFMKKSVLSLLKVKYLENWLIY